MEYIDSICAITTYKPGEFHKTRVSIYSFITNNPWFDGKVLILTVSDSKLSEFESAALDQIYKDIEILKVDLSSLEKKLNKRSLDQDYIFNFLYLYALKIKSRGNLYFSNSVVINRDSSQFLHSYAPTFPIKNGSLPSGLGVAVNTAMFYIPGEICSDLLYESAIKHLNESNNIFDLDSRSNSILMALNGLDIQVNRIDLINLIDASNFPDTKYREFLRYSKAIGSINMNTLDSNDSRYIRMNLYWQSINKSSLNYNPTSADPRLNRIHRDEYLKSSKLNNYLKYLKDKRIIVVGPSPSILGKGYGEYIDSFDVVIRTNGGIKLTLTNPVDYGTRCNVLYTNGYFSNHLNSSDVDLINDKEVSFIISKSPIKIIKKFKRVLKSSITGWKYLTDLGNIINCVPLSGTYILYEIISSSSFNSLMITGMDFYEDINNIYTNGYLPGEFKYNYHNNDLIHNYKEQSKYINELINTHSNITHLK